MGPDGFALVALGVYKNGQIVYKRGYGMADLTRSRARIMICRVGEYPTATVAVICFQIPGNLCRRPAIPEAVVATQKVRAAVVRAIEKALDSPAAYAS